MEEWYLLNSIWIIILDQEIKTKGKKKQDWKEKISNNKNKNVNLSMDQFRNKAFRLQWSFD